MTWEVNFKKSTQKQLDKLPKSISEIVLFLVREIEQLGPLRHNWKNFGKLGSSKSLYHCHIKSGKPTYVAC